MKKKKSFSITSDHIFDVFNTLILILFSLIVLYPIIVVVSSSFSSPNALMAGKVLFAPIDPTLDGYRAVINHPDIWMGIKNSIFYTVVGTIINLVVSVLAAYPLSRKDFTSRGWISLFFAFTMWFGGGLIPTFLLIKDMGLYNTRAVMLIPLAMNVWNMIIVRTYFQSNISDDLLEVAKIDGCSDIRFLTKIVVPLSKPVLAVVALYYAVANWNIYAHAYIYINKPELQPIQVVLRDILLLNSTQEISVDVTKMGKSEQLSELLKYSLVVVASIPMILIYPFVQKHFVKGIMVGSVKG